MSYIPDHHTLRRALGIAALVIAAVSVASCGDSDDQTAQAPAAIAAVPAEVPENYRVAGVDPPTPDDAPDIEDQVGDAAPTDACESSDAGAHVQDTRYR